MNAEQIVWHVLGLCAQPAWLAFWSSAIAKAVWRQELRWISLPRLTATSFSIDLGVAIVWLVATQHDGRMAADAAMVLCTAAHLGWAMRR